MAATAPNLGWHDPRWASLYPTRFPSIEQQQAAPPPQPQPASTSGASPSGASPSGASYLDHIQAAAAAGQAINLADMPGFVPAALPQVAPMADGGRS